MPFGYFAVHQRRVETKPMFVEYLLLKFYGFIVEVKDRIDVLALGVNDFHDYISAIVFTVRQFRPVAATFSFLSIKPLPRALSRILIFNMQSTWRPSTAYCSLSLAWSKSSDF